MDMMVSESFKVLNEMYYLEIQRILDVSNNEEHGIFAYGVTNVAIVSNTANNNKMNGISLSTSDGNFIFSNTANGNINGTYLLTSDNNIVSDNLFLNNVNCYSETDSNNNLFSNNICTAPITPSPGLDPFILGLIFGLAIGLGALAVVIILSLVRGRKK
ncbi:MAG: NosD domain-containing protein [Promethearchaeota archaeon]